MQLKQGMQTEENVYINGMQLKQEKNVNQKECNSISNDYHNQEYIVKEINERTKQMRILTLLFNKTDIPL